MIIDGVRLLSLAALGVFAGAMLTEGFILVPYWRSLPAADFFAWYAANDRRLLGFFGPVTAVAMVLAVAAAVGALWQGDSRRWFAVTAAVLAIVATSTFFIYFREVNASFSAATIGAAELPAELSRWASWHWLRTVLSFAALAASLAALPRVDLRGAKSVFSQRFLHDQ